MTAELIAKALGGRRVGCGWVVSCPAHDDRTPSLSIRETDDHKVLVRCHAVCSQVSVISAFRALGLWTESARCRTPRGGRRVDVAPKLPEGDPVRGDLALRLWKSSKPASGTLVETYLLSRGIRLKLPRSLRFHARLRHPSGGVWPAMVALVESGADGVPVAIHRTFLARDGGGKAPVEPQRMMLGPCRGGAVRLAEPGDVLMVGEGIETCLAAMFATGHPAWAALSTSGLRALDLPSRVRDVIVLADADESGEAAAQDCARRWKRQCRRVRIARPPKGMDFNDLLRTRAVHPGEGAQ